MTSKDKFRFHQFERPLERPPFTLGPINTTSFHAYIEQFLVPTLSPGGYSLERRCTVCGQDEYSCGAQASECPGPPENVKRPPTIAQTKRAMNAMLDIELGLS